MPDWKDLLPTYFYAEVRRQFEERLTVLGYRSQYHDNGVVQFEKHATKLEISCVEGQLPTHELGVNLALRDDREGAWLYLPWWFLAREKCPTFAPLTFDSVEELRSALARIDSVTIERLLNEPTALLHAVVRFETQSSTVHVAASRRHLP